MHVTESKVDAFAHCSDSRCRGNRQEAVKASRTHTEISFMDSGGDMPGTEKSMVSLAFVSAKDAECKVCGGPREVSEQKRPVYPGMSGHAQDGLLSIKLPDGSFITSEAEDDRVASLEAQIAELKDLVMAQAKAA